MAQGEQRACVHTEPPAAPASLGMSLQMMIDAALIPLLSRLRGSFTLSSTSLLTNLT